MRLPHFPNMTAKSFAKTLFKEISGDDVFSLAAQMAYYFLFSLFPLMVFLVALLGFLPVENLMDQLLGELQRVAPREFYEIVETHLKDVVLNERPALLSVSVIIALYSASAGVNATIQCLNRAYEVNDSRGFFKVRLTALALTAGVSLLIILSAGLVISGDAVAGWIGETFGRFGQYYAFGWKVVQWLISPAAILLALAILYYFGPDVKQEWKWITPGSAAATLLWLGATVGFSYYVSNFGNYNATYGSLGGVMVTMLWLYISSLIVLIGGEVNAVLEHASAEGKDAGERAPGVDGGRQAGEPVTGKSVDSPQHQAMHEKSQEEQSDDATSHKQRRKLGALFHRRERHDGHHAGAQDGQPEENGNTSGSSNDPLAKRDDRGPREDLLH